MFEAKFPDIFNFHSLALLIFMMSINGKLVNFIKGPSIIGVPGRFLRAPSRRGAAHSFDGRNMGPSSVFIAKMRWLPILFLYQKGEKFRRKSFFAHNSELDQSVYLLKSDNKLLEIT